MRLSAAFLGLALLLAPATFARADAFDAKTVPADAKWVIHMDADAVQASQLWDIVYKKAQQNPDTQNGIDQLETVTGMKFPKDMHDVTLYGNSFEPDAGVILLHAHTDQEKTLAALKANPSYGSSTYGKYEIHTWEDKGKVLFGTYHDAELIILSNTSKNVEAAIDVLDHKTEPLKLSASLRAGIANGKLLFIAGDGLSNMKTGKPQNPMLAQVDAAWIAIGEQGKDFVLHGAMVAKTIEAAQQLQASVDGIKAMVVLSGTSQDADAKGKAAAAALQKLTTAVSGTTVTIDWPISLDLIKENIDNAGPKPAPAPKAPAPQ
jgi:hypothetical protein